METGNGRSGGATKPVCGGAGERPGVGVEVLERLHPTPLRAVLLSVPSVQLCTA